MSMTAFAATAPVMEAPEMKLYGGDVPVRVSMPGGNASAFVLEFAYYTPNGWSEPVSKQAAAEAGGRLDTVVPASWFSQIAAAARWRVRACLDDGGASCSEWRMFGRSTDMPAAAPGDRSPTGVQAPSAGTRRSPAAGRESRGSSGSGVVVVVSPTPGGYAQDVPLVIQSPTSRSVVMQLEYLDVAANTWVAAHEEQIDTDASGAVNSAIALEALAQLQPAAASWRLRARSADSSDAWSPWVTFSVPRGR